MIRRLHRLAPGMIAIGLMALGLTIGASASGGPAQSGFVTQWAEWIVGNAIAIFGGFVGWAHIVLRGAKARADHAVELHDADEDAHHAASSKNHDPLKEQLHEIRLILQSLDAKTNTLVEGQKTAVAELDEQDARLGSLEKGLAQLLTEHCLLHGQALRKRSGDPEALDPDGLRGPG